MEDKKAVTGKRTLLPIHFGSDGADTLNPYRGLSKDDSPSPRSIRPDPSKRSERSGSKGKNKRRLYSQPPRLF